MAEKTADGQDNATITICAGFQRKNVTIGANGVKKELTAGHSATGINPLLVTSLTNRPMSATPAETVYAEAAPITGTGVMVNMSIPMKAEETAALPCDGVGLMRSEFLFTNYVGEHPMAVIAEGRQDELINKLADGITKVCRAFYPRKVVLRTSDFKTNEYRDMKGGADFEPREDNPMIGWRDRKSVV